MMVVVSCTVAMMDRATSPVGVKKFKYETNNACISSRPDHADRDALESLKHAVVPVRACSASDSLPNIIVHPTLELSALSNIPNRLFQIIQPNVPSADLDGHPQSAVRHRSVPVILGR